VYSDIDKVSILKIYALFLPTNSEVLEGKVNLIINSEIQKVFVVPPQMANTEKNPFEQGALIIATNFMPATLIKP
jgi:hypothetical protein